MVSEVLKRSARAVEVSRNCHGTVVSP